MSKFVLDEQLVKENDEQFKLTSEFVRGQRTPPKPKRGEILICQMCGEPIYPNQLAEDRAQRKREFKWRVHHECWELSFRYCDLNTRGVGAEQRRIPLPDFDK